VNPALQELKKTLRTNQISTDPLQCQNYGRDWTRSYIPNAQAVLFPESIEQVQEIVLWARKNRSPLVPSGGRTGLSGGAVAANGEFVVSLERLRQIFELNEIEQTVRCEAGVITENLQHFVSASGFYFPVDFASRGSSQIGGNIATNAGGTKVIRYGLMRDWILSLKVVTGAGEILQLNRDLVKNNSGYDLRHLFIGSEGTLGIICETTLRITQPPKDLTVLLIQIPALEHSIEILTRFRKQVSLTAFEFFTDKALDYVLQQHSDFTRPFSKTSSVYLLIEFENQSPKDLESAMEAFDTCLAAKILTDGAVSQNSQQFQTFWKYREDISESLSPLKPYKNDISVRISKIPEFVSAAEKMLSKQFPKNEIIWFGHIGDGNLHINVLRHESQSDEDFSSDCKSISQSLFELLQKLGGSISAEHGIGLTKKPYLHFSRSPEEIRLMRAIKKVLDPDGILNPGKIFDITPGGT